jgi:hypothetical protein
LNQSQITFYSEYSDIFEYELPFSSSKQFEKNILKENQCLFDILQKSTPNISDNFLLNYELQWALPSQVPPFNISSKNLTSDITSLYELHLFFDSIGVNCSNGKFKS